MLLEVSEGRVTQGEHCERHEQVAVINVVLTSSKYIEILVSKLRNFIGGYMAQRRFKLSCPKWAYQVSSNRSAKRSD
jgi:hypothetical protein